MTIIHADRQVEHHKFDRPVTLRELQCAVGGYIEAVPYFHRWEGRPCVVFCNEMGKLERLPINPVASALWAEAVDRDPGDRIVGSVAILTGDRAFMERL